MSSGWVWPVLVMAPTFRHMLHHEGTKYTKRTKALRLQELWLGLLINFNVEVLRDGIRRVLNGLALFAFFVPLW